MRPLFAGAIIGLAIIGLALYALGRAALARLIAGAAATERARRAEADLAIARAQGKIMAERRSVDDVADDLDRGRF